MITSRNHWFEVFGDIEKETSKELHILRRLAEKMQQRALKAERQLDAAQDKVTQQRHEIYDLATQLEEEKSKNLKLMAQMNRDYENSSIPSSKSVKYKKISNSREKTDRKQGAGPGHQGHGRKKQIPTSEPVLLKAPQEVLDDPDFKKTSKTIVKQLVGIRLLLDVNYDGSIKAFLFLLNNECCTSIDKSRKFLSDLTGGELNISRGMINQLSKEFKG